MGVGCGRGKGDGVDTVLGGVGAGGGAAATNTAPLGIWQLFTMPWAGSRPKKLLVQLTMPLRLR
jgi:hypothetical protein